MWNRRRKMIPIESAVTMATLKFQTLLSICTFNFILFTSLGTGSTYPQSQFHHPNNNSSSDSHLINSRQLLQPSPSYYYRNIYRNRNYYNKLMSGMIGGMTTTTTSTTTEYSYPEITDLNTNGHNNPKESETSEHIHNHSYNSKKYYYPTTPSYTKQDLYNTYNNNQQQQQQRHRKPTTTTPTPPSNRINYDQLTLTPRRRVTQSSHTASATTTTSTESPIVFFPSAQTPEIVDTSASAYIRTNNNNNNNLIDLGFGGPTNNVIVVPQNYYSGQIKGSLIPPECDSDLGYCEEHDTEGKLEYPKTIINSLLQKLPFTPSEFKQIYGETNDNSTQTTDLKLLERTGLGNNFDESPLCSSIEHTIYPRVARNKDNKWMYIVNHDEYIQGVRVEKCLDEGQPCIFSDTFSPPGFVTTCRQKYIYKKLLALSPEGRTQTDSFKLPSCCVCYVKRIGSGSSSSSSGNGNGFTRTKSSPDDSLISRSTSTNSPISTISTTPTISTRSSGSGSGQMIFNDESGKPIITGTTTTSDL